MKKTKLVTLLGAISLIGAIGAGSTFAYLTSTTGTVTNTFTVGNVNFDDDPLTGGLSESKVARDENSNLYVDADGTGEWTVKENKYEDLVAGEVVYKDPTVHMADDSQDAWVFAKIVNANPDLTITYASDWIDVTDADKKVYAKKDVISKSAHSTIFEEVTVGNNVTEDTTFTDIKVSACAVQAAGFASYTDALAQVSFN